MENAKSIVHAGLQEVLKNLKYPSEEKFLQEKLLNGAVLSLVNRH
ncbi:MAG: hypothetical protein ACREBU_26230 [Nitrososphaera sp.]